MEKNLFGYWVIVFERLANSKKSPLLTIVQLRGGKVSQNIHTSVEKAIPNLPSFYTRDYRRFKKGVITLKRKLSDNELFALVQYSKMWENAENIVGILRKNPLVPPFTPGLRGGKELPFIPANPIYERVVEKSTKSWLSGPMLNKIILILVITIFIATSYVIFEQDRLLRLSDKTIKARDAVIKIKDNVIRGKDTLIKIIKGKCVKKILETAKDYSNLKNEVQRIPELEETLSQTRDTSAKRSKMLKDLTSKLKRICQDDKTMHPDCNDYRTSRQFEEMKAKLLKDQQEKIKQDLHDWNQGKFEKF